VPFQAAENNFDAGGLPGRGNLPIMPEADIDAHE